MTLDTSQLGRAGDQVDLGGAIRGGPPVVGLQVKTENHLDKGGQVEARASYPPGTVRQDPAFPHVAAQRPSNCLPTQVRYRVQFASSKNQ